MKLMKAGNIDYLPGEGEVRSLVGQHGVSLVRNEIDQSSEEVGSDAPGRSLMQLGKSKPRKGDFATSKLYRRTPPTLVGRRDWEIQAGDPNNMAKSHDGTALDGPTLRRCHQNASGSDSRRYD